MSSPSRSDAARSVSEMSGTFRPMMRLALPVLAEQLLHAMVMLVDVWLAGKYLKEAPELAAIGLMAYTLWLLSCVFDFVSVGATALTARFVGAGDLRHANQATNQAVLLGLGMAVATTLVGLLVCRPFVHLMDLEDRAAELAVRYLYFILPVLPAIMIQRVGVACLRGVGDMVTVFWLMAVLNVVNVSLSSALVIGLGPAPRLGWDGLAIGTATAHLVTGMLMLALLVRGHRGLRLTFRAMRPQRDLIARMLRVGIPGGMDTMLVIGCHLFYLRIINQLGDAAAAAHNVGIRLESLAFLPGSAFSLAAMTLAGQFLGARDYDRAGRSVLMATVTGCGIMLGVGVMFFFAGRPLADLFLDPGQVEIAAQTAELLRIASFAMLPLGLVMVLTGAMRGAGDTRWPLLFTLIGFLGVRIPGTYWLAMHLGWGVTGAWYAMLADLMVRCVLVLYRFVHGGWKRIEV